MILPNRLTILLVLNVALFSSSVSYAQTGEQIAKTLLSEMAEDSRKIGAVSDYTYGTNRAMNGALGIKGGGLKFEICDSANALKVFTWDVDDAIKVASFLRYSQIPVPVHVWFSGYYRDGLVGYSELKPLIFCYCYNNGRFITHNFETESMLSQDPLLTMYGAFPPEFIQLNDMPNKSSNVSAVAYKKVADCLSKLLVFVSPSNCATASMAPPLVYQDTPDSEPGDPHVSDCDGITFCYEFYEQVHPGTKGVPPTLNESEKKKTPGAYGEFDSNKQKITAELCQFAVLTGKQLEKFGEDKCFVFTPPCKKIRKLILRNGFASDQTALLAGEQSQVQSGKKSRMLVEHFLVELMDILPIPARAGLQNQMDVLCRCLLESMAPWEGSVKTKIGRHTTG